MEKKEETQVEQTTVATDAKTHDDQQDQTTGDDKQTQGQTSDHRGRGRGRGGRGRGRGGYRGRGDRGRGGERGGRGDFRGDRDDREERRNTECTVFVNNLKWSTSWQYLKDVMRDYGDVVRVDIFKDSQGRSKGFGTVEFSSKEDVQKAIKEANNIEIDGRTIQVREEISREQREKDKGVQIQKKDVPEKKSGEKKAGFGIFVGNLPFSVTSDQLKNAFQSYGKILECNIPTNKSGMSKGWGLIRFETHDQAKEAIKDMHDAKFNDRQVQVREDRDE